MDQQKQKQLEEGEGGFTLMVHSLKLSESTKIDFIDLDPREVARQLTLIEFDLFTKIRAIDLYRPRTAAIDGPENNNGGGATVGAIDSLINRFNVISGWVASEIVLTSNSKLRTAIVCKFVRLGQVLFNRCTEAIFNPARISNIPL